MTTDNTSLLTSIEDTFSEMLAIISSADEKAINTIPFEGSWTAAQVTDHVTRSIHGMAEVLQMPGKIIERQPDEKVTDLKTMFLNFDSKMKSPPFILPEHEVYEKEFLITKFSKASTKFIEAAKNVNVSELVDLRPLGELTKLEILHFILYHTQRHIQQVKNILEK